eukprot:scaffold29394_cov51-Attheya_sp.AAC.1
MAYRVSFETLLHHVRLSTHVMLYPGNSDSENFRHSNFVQPDDMKQKEKQTTNSRRNREKVRVFELFMKARSAKIVPGRKMHKDLFIKLISEVRSPLQTTETPDRNKSRDKEVTAL